MALTKVTGSVIKDSVSLSGNVSVGGTLTYQDVTNVDALGIGTFRTGIKVLAGQVDIGSNIKLGNAGVVTATTFVGNLTGTASANAVLTGSTNNQLVTVTGANAITGEANLTFDGSNTLAITGPEGGSARIDLIADEGDDAGDKWRITNTSSNDFKIQRTTSHTDTLVILSNGRVGINTSATNRQLMINDEAGGGIGIQGANAGIFMGTVAAGGFTNNAGIARAAAVNCHITNSAVGDLCIAAESTKDILFGTGASAGQLAERFRIASGGNLLASGITTSNAGFMFGTDGEMYLYKSAANTATLRVTSDGPYAEFKDVSGDLHMGSASGSLRLSAGGAEKVRITSSATHFGSSGTLNDSNTVSIIPSDGRISFGMDGRTSYVTGETACYIYSGEGSSGTTLAGELILQSRSNVNRNITFVTGATPTVQMIVYGSGGVFAHTKNNFLLNEFRRGDTSTQYGPLSTSWATDTTISDTISNYQRGQRIIIRCTVPCGIALGNSSGANYGGTNVRIKVTGNTSGGTTYSNNRPVWCRADGAGTHETTINLFICVYINESDTTFSNGETLTVNLQGQKNGGGAGSSTHYLGGWSSVKEITIERYIKEL